MNIIRVVTDPVVNEIFLAITKNPARLINLAYRRSFYDGTWERSIQDLITKEAIARKVAVYSNVRNAIEDMVYEFTVNMF